MERTTSEDHHDLPSPVCCGNLKPQLGRLVLRFISLRTGTSVPQSSNVAIYMHVCMRIRVCASYRNSTHNPLYSTQ